MADLLSPRPRSPNNQQHAEQQPPHCYADHFAVVYIPTYLHTYIIYIIMFVVMYTTMLFLLCISIPSVMGRVNYLTCDSMYIGYSTGHGAIGSTTSYSLNVKRGTTTLSDGSSYTPGETLTVSLPSVPSQYAIEMDGGATFVSGGKCSNKRKDNGGGSITLPPSGSGTVTIKAVARIGSSVSMVTSFTFIEQTSSPTPSPSHAPTASPSGPSAAPTVQPTAPTPLPTLNPTPNPTTSQPTSTPTNSTLMTSSDEQKDILSSGIVAAIIVFAVLPLGSYGYYTYQSGKNRLTKVAIEVV